jgi:ABC-2 type transport system permease protein
VPVAAFTQVAYLARRSVVRTVRQPIMIVPSLTFPLILLAVNASGLSAATSLPGFPTDTYVTFAIAFAFLQGAMFATINGGQALAEDLQKGFFNRLQLTPLRGPALLAGQLAGVVALGIVQAVVFLSVGLLAGGQFAAGVAGVAVLLALSVLIAMAFGALGLFLGLRTGSAEAVQGMFPLLFILLFFSSMALPRDLIANDWFRAIADWNPVSYMLEGIRSLFIDGWNAEALALGFGLAAALLVAGLAAASTLLRTRMVRT